MTTFVIKTDGRKEKFYPEKIKKVIQWATQDLDVNPLVLESKFDEFVREEIKTDDIQRNLIYHARILCTPEEPEWSIVAGRLETMRRWKRTQIFEKSFYYYIKEQLDDGFYKHPGIKKWIKREIVELGETIVQERDLDHSYGSVLTATDKYLVPNECIQQMHMVNAMIIASVEKREVRLDIAKQIYEALSKRKISLATPWLGNLRSDKNIASCFIIQVDDNMESIFDNVKNAAMISKYGGGLGIDMSKIRAKGAAVDIVDNASKGITSWTKIFNDVAVSVDQGGRRAGAFTVHCPIWHEDIEDFIEIQSENGDFRKKAFDIFPQVGVYDIFMKEVIKEDGGTWYTFCPYEVKKVLNLDLVGVFGKEFNGNYRKAIKAYESGNLKNVGVYNAKELLKNIMRIQFETGLPYIGFLDHINEMNPNNHDGYIPCTNLCTESYSNLSSDELAHTCNLTSIVVGRVDSDEEMIELSGLCTRILDNGITLTNPPIKESKAHNERYRTIGIGIQGMHDYVARHNLNWTKDIEEIAKVAELIEYGAVKASVDLAELRGPYPAFEGSKWDNGELIAHFKKHSHTDLDWDQLQKCINKSGIRNSQLTSPAPNTSTSLFMDASAGTLPVYASFYNEDNRSGKFSVYGMYLKENPLAYERTQSRMNQAELTKVVGALQKFVDTGISAEYIFDQNNGITAKDLYELIISAWKNQNKAIYYIRSIKRGETIEKIVGGEVVCAGCAG
jgi:ribonucleoside-diphosphate reductase alpha chain